MPNVTDRPTGQDVLRNLFFSFFVFFIFSSFFFFFLFLFQFFFFLFLGNERPPRSSVRSGRATHRRRFRAPWRRCHTGGFRRSRWRGPRRSRCCFKRVSANCRCDRGEDDEGGADERAVSEGNCEKTYSSGSSFLTTASFLISFFSFLIGGFTSSSESSSITAGLRFEPLAGSFLAAARRRGVLGVEAPDPEAPSLPAAAAAALLSLRRSF